MCVGLFWEGLREPEEVRIKDRWREESEKEAGTDQLSTDILVLPRDNQLLP